MQHQKIKGLVIRETDFGESNRYITVLTENGRQIEVLCKRVRRKNENPAIRLFCLSEFTVYEKRDNYTLSEASLIHSFWNITGDIEKYALACYFAQCAMASSDTSINAPELTQLMLYALYALCDKGKNPALIKAAFEFRLMALSGFAPYMSCCAVCSKPTQNDIYFSVQHGAVIDKECFVKIKNSEYIKLGKGTAEAMKYILSCKTEKLFNFTLGENSLNQLGEISENYVIYHMDRQFSTLEFYHSLCPIKNKGKGYYEPISRKITGNT